MMAKKPEDRYQSMKDVIADLESVQRGEPPLQARRQYDASLLAGLESGGETVEIESPVEKDITDTGVSLVWVFVLGGLLGLSLIVNIILAVRH
jgi:hypothetical protein